jgi:hypothetical protein
MNSRIMVVVVVAICVLGMLAGYHMYLTNNRYYIIGGERGIAYEVDRVTGQSWMLAGANKKEHQNPSSTSESLSSIPWTELEKVTGNAGLGNGSFSGKIYNGSTTWTIKKIVFRVTAKDKRDVDGWTRDLVDDVTIAPLTTQSFLVAVTGDDNIESSSWTITAAYGYQR